MTRHRNQASFREPPSAASAVLACVGVVAFIAVAAALVHFFT